jgi:predicted O-methyltransferase YrrM
MRQFDFWDLEWIAKRFNPLPTGDDFLDTRYDWQRDANGAEWPYYRFFYHLAKMLQPELVVELGGYQGTAAAHFAKGLEDAKGTVITIDHHSDPGDELNKEKMLLAQNACYNLTYLQGWTCDKTAVLQQGQHALGDRPSVFQLMDFEPNCIDILFIDSWHHYQYAMADWEAYKPLLKSPALVICDDIQDGSDPQAPIYDMMRFWRQMPDPKFLDANLHPGTNMGFVLLCTEKK